MQTNPKMTQVLKVADKDFKRCITTMLSEIKKNISLKWMKTKIPANKPISGNSRSRK